MRYVILWFVLTVGFAVDVALAESLLRVIGSGLACAVCLLCFHLSTMGVK